MKCQIGIDQGGTLRQERNHLWFETLVELVDRVLACYPQAQFRLVLAECSKIQPIPPKS